MVCVPTVCTQVVNSGSREGENSRSPPSGFFFLTFNLYFHWNYMASWNEGDK